MLRRVVALLAAVAAMSTGGSAFAGREPGGTTVTVDGHDVTIVVRVDCVGCNDFVDPVNGRDLAAYWEKQAEDAWNAGFAKFSYCNEYKFTLDIKMNNRRAGSASRFGTHELIATQPDGSGFRGAGWGGAPEGTPAGPSGQTAVDGTRYFEFDGQGTMPADATPTVIAHEFGHVIGLGDDRDASGFALPGRDNTLMVGGAAGVTPRTKLKIDKALIDRIGDQIANHGDITCGQVWKGTMHHTVTSSTSAGGPCPNPVVLDGKVRLVVKPNGVVVGTYDVTGCGVSEPHADFGGRKNERGFSLPRLIVQTNGELIPEVRDGRARARLTNLQGTTTWVTDWDLRCVEGCSEGGG